MTKRLLLAVSILSASGLLLEISLTKLLSSIYFPPYVFAVISLAILGIGLGAGLATWQRRFRVLDLAQSYAALASISVVLLILALVYFSSYAIQPLLFILVTLPYFFIGLILATLFSQSSTRTSQLYMVDLVGAGLGTMLVIPLLDGLGATNSTLIAGLGLGLVALILHPDYGSWLEFGALLLVGGLLIGNTARDWFVVDLAQLPTAKPITEILQSGGEILETRSDSFSRTDLVDPNDGSPLRIYVDGGAASIMPPAAIDRNLIGDVGFFPFATGQPERVFIIGPGGGLDVWFGLQSGAKQIDAVEANPSSNELVKKYAFYNGDIYHQPTVKIIADEGRSALRRTDEPYDLIFLSQVVTLVAERNGYALTENGVYTIEAFHDYLDHLTPEGQIAMKLYDEITLTRALSTAVAALRERGLSDSEALTHIMVILDSRHNPPIPLLIVKNTPFLEDDALVLGSIARDVGLAPVLLPHVLVQPPLDGIADGSTTFADIVADSEQDISPTTDNRPFFYQFERGIPDKLKPLLGAIVVIIVLSGLFVAWFMRSAEGAQARKLPLYFVCLGAGFIAVEIVILQKTQLFLGHPTISTTITLATLLIGGGLGSGLVARLDIDAQKKRLFLSSVGVVIVLGIWMLVWPVLSDQFLSQSLTGRALVAILSIFPLGIMMGMPFPIGMALAAPHGEQHVALAWAVNGIATVIGTILTVTAAIVFGFNIVLIGGMIVYGIAAILLFR